MKEFMRFIALGVVIAQRMLAQEATPTIKGLRPTNNIEAARSKFPLSDLGRIAPNTLAFEEFGLNFMLGKANEMRDAWNLDISRPLTINHVVFQLRATVHGLDGGLGTRDKRYDWAFSRNAVEIFRDNNYSPFLLGYKSNELARLAKIESKISANEAEATAREALNRLGLAEKHLRLKEPPIVEQHKFEDSDGKIHLLPLFDVAWRLKGHAEPEGEESDYKPLKMVVSGITKQVVDYFNVVPHTPRAPTPTNYFQMLGLPANYLETLPQRQRLLWGLPPLTNSASPTAESSK